MLDQTKREIKEIIVNVITKKANEYAAETEYKPFFTALFDKKTIEVGSIIQSLYTSFGISVYEQIAVVLARSAGYEAHRQYTLKGTIDNATDNYISAYWENLKTGLKNRTITGSDKQREITKIKEIIQPGIDGVDGDSTVDVFIKKPNGEEYYFDISTVKNNLKGFESLKLKMLRWIALRASIDKTVKAQTFIAIPYNPYYPNDYLGSRWNSTILDKQYDILVQEDFWNLVGGDPNTYNDLLNVFEEAGEEIKPLLNRLFG